MSTVPSGAVIPQPRSVSWNDGYLAATGQSFGLELWDTLTWQHVEQELLPAPIRIDGLTHYIDWNPINGSLSLLIHTTL